MSSRTLPAFILTIVVACALVLGSCTNLGMSHAGNPMCGYAERKCDEYRRTMKQAGTDRGLAVDMMREDCEASQRACAESVSRELESSVPVDPEKKRRSLWE